MPTTPGGRPPLARRLSPAGGLRNPRFEIYRGNYERYLKPAFRQKRLHEITVDHVAALVADMNRKGYSGWTINGTLTPLGRIFATAERAGLIQSNPVRKLDHSERPRVSTDERRILNEAEIGQLLKKGGSFKTLLAVGAFGGLRLGEALGLIWADIDFDEGVIRVRKQLGRDRQRTPLKTGRSRREVILMPQLARVLREHRMASPYKQPEDPVFPAPDGRGRDHRSTSRGVERAVERAGLDGVSFHSLRHGFASMLIVELKQDVESVSRQLGHANSTITLVDVFARVRTSTERRQAARRDERTVRTSAHRVESTRFSGRRASDRP